MEIFKRLAVKWLDGIKYILLGGREAQDQHKLRWPESSQGSNKPTSPARRQG